MRDSWPGDFNWGYTMEQFQEMDHPDGYTYHVFCVFLVEREWDSPRSLGQGIVIHPFVASDGEFNTAEETIENHQDRCDELQSGLEDDPSVIRVAYIGTIISVYPVIGSGRTPKSRYPIPE